MHQDSPPPAAAPFDLPARGDEHDRAVVGVNYTLAELLNDCLMGALDSKRTALDMDLFHKGSIYKARFVIDTVIPVVPLEQLRSKH